MSKRLTAAGILGVIDEMKVRASECLHDGKALRDKAAKLIDQAAARERDSYSLKERMQRLEEEFVCRTLKVATHRGVMVTDLAFEVGGEAVRVYTGMDGRFRIQRSELVDGGLLDGAPDEASRHDVADAVVW